LPNCTFGNEERAQYRLYWAVPYVGEGSQNRPFKPEGSIFRPFSYTLHTHKPVRKKPERKSSACALGKRKKKKKKKEKEKKNFLSLLVKSLKRKLF
jgi:hypothetical protein